MFPNNKPANFVYIPSSLSNLMSIKQEPADTQPREETKQEPEESHTMTLRKKRVKVDSDEEYTPTKSPRKRQTSTGAKSSGSKSSGNKSDPIRNIPSPNTLSAILSADKTGQKKSKIKMELADDFGNLLKPKKKKNYYSCKICGDVFTNSKILTKHRKTHKKAPEDVKKYEYTINEDGNTFTCNTCEAEYNSKEDMEKHLEVHSEKFTCPICPDVFKDPYKCAIHVYEHDKEYFPCPICEYRTIRRTAILSHIKRIHLKKFTYHCQHCGKGFDDVRLHQEHENTHLEDAPTFVCIVCNKTFPYSRYLYTHQVRYHDVKIDGVIMSNQCEVCLKVFAKITSLLNHMKKHTQVNVIREKKHLCEVCGKGYARPDKLKIHKRIHTGFKPYSCSYCSKSFIKKEYLVMHERIHSGEKPYSCMYCGKCFNQGAPLRIHIRSHTGERPYICHLCETGYISKGALNLHLKACPGKNYNSE